MRKEKIKIKLSGLESFLMKIADQLRKNMEESEYREYIFGMLFLKRMSDVFDEKRDELRKTTYKHLPKEVCDDILEKKNTYGDMFFIPQRARWNEGWYDDEEDKDIPALKDLKTDIGPMLNKALAAIEDANSSELQGILKERINFNKLDVEGKPVIKNADLRSLIEAFNDFPALINENFEFDDLLGAAYEFLLKYFADSAGKKGGQFYTPTTVVRLLVKLLQLDEGMSVYDPTCGSGGMLIQSHQYIEDEGKNPQNLELYGQDNKDPVVAICKMNMIFHDIFDSHIMLGDVIGNPRNVENGRIKQFDRVIANPPFSQNYTKNEMLFESRFKYGFLPENGKKADLMFVQHMLASCKDTGRIVVVMPHGVLFRGRKEKEIRQKMIEDDVIEGVIGLPPQLFYGASIPACLLILRKQKPDELKNRIFFINADKEFLPGKKQNMLRPEDIEKISYVYLNKIPVPNYSRFVDVRKEIEPNDFTLNIRKYVDNTPAPEPHDVRAHLLGGVPVSEVNEMNHQLCRKMNFATESIFTPRANDSIYDDFTVSDKREIKAIVEKDKGIAAVVGEMHYQLGKWWKTASEEFATIANNKGSNLPKVRSSLLHTMKEVLQPIGVLDQYQVAGIFVNWWDNIKYDLKTIRQRGWDIELVNPERDDLIIARYFSKEQADIDESEKLIAEKEQAIEEQIETALDAVDYEPEEPEDGEEAKEEKHTPKLAREQVKLFIDELTEEGDVKEVERLQAILDELKVLEDQLKAQKDQLKHQQEHLQKLIELKCYGADDSKESAKALMAQVFSEMNDLNFKAGEVLIRDSWLQTNITENSSCAEIVEQLNTLKRKHSKTKKLRTEEDEKVLAIIAKYKKELDKLAKQYNKLNSQVSKINDIMDNYDKQLEKIGGQITEHESRELILQKHYDLIASQLTRYADAESRAIVSAGERLYDKYALSARQITKQRDDALTTLTTTLKSLNYID